MPGQSTLLTSHTSSPRFSFDNAAPSPPHGSRRGVYCVLSTFCWYFHGWTAADALGSGFTEDLLLLLRRDLAVVPSATLVVFHPAMSLPPNTHEDESPTPRNQGQTLVSMYVSIHSVVSLH